MTDLTTLWQIARGRLYLRLPMLALPLGLIFARIMTDRRFRYST